MEKKRLLSAVLAAVLAAGTAMQTGASGVHYLPDVTQAMSDGAYWSTDSGVQMTWEEIKTLNGQTIAADGTNMYDLKNQAEIVNGKSLNEALENSARADAAYYLGWTYLGEDRLARQHDFERMIRNTQNRWAEEEQPVQYAVAVRRTNLRAFPSETPIWDDPKDHDFDYQYLVGVRVNEPLVITSVSADENFYLAKSVCCSGWVPVEDVAICRDKEEWLSAWDLESSEALVVYGDRVYTEMSNTAAETSELMLTMGTVLELADTQSLKELVDNRAVYQNHVVWMPVRDEEGNYSKKLTLIPERAEVSRGYLPLTQENVMQVAMEGLGNAYGWGGSLNAEDCSSYIRNIYKCFGLELARNTTWQAAMPVAKVSMSGMCREDRLKVLNAMPAGSVLFFSGHEMMYLGRENGKYYVISSVSKIRDPLGGTGNQRIRSVIINTLDITRASGVTWLDALTSANVPYWGLREGKEYDLPGKSWYHDAVAYCMQKKLMSAGADALFMPEGKVTQAQLVQSLWTMAGKPGVETEQGSVWYAQAAAWAAAERMLPEDGFEPDAAMTREQAARMLYCWAKAQGKGFSGLWMFLLDYADAAEIDRDAYEAVCWLTMKGVVSGGEGNLLRPKGELTRAELAVMLQRFAQV